MKFISDLLFPFRNEICFKSNLIEYLIQELLFHSRKLSSYYIGNNNATILAASSLNLRYLNDTQLINFKLHCIQYTTKVITDLPFISRLKASIHLESWQSRRSRSWSLKWLAIGFDNVTRIFNILQYMVSRVWIINVFVLARTFSRSFCNLLCIDDTLVWIETNDFQGSAWRNDS